MQNPLQTFKNSGKKPGLEIWVVKTVIPPKESFPCIFKSPPKTETEYEVFPVPPRRHGIFYNDDLYVLVNTSSDLSQKDVHFWFGCNYADTPPKWVNNFEMLDLNWKMTQHFEFQSYECPLFESYFTKVTPIIRYKRGKHPEPDAERKRGQTRFYKVERRENSQYRVKEIPFNIALMTKEECFILDTDFNTRAYISDRTKIADKNKSIIASDNIRDLDHEGNGDVEIVDLTTFTNEGDREKFTRAKELIEAMEPESVEEVDLDQPEDEPENVTLNSLLYLFGDDVYPPRFKYIPKPKKVNVEEKVQPKAGLLTRFKKCVVRAFGFEKEVKPESELPKLEDKYIKTLVRKPIAKEAMTTQNHYVLHGSVGKPVYLWVGKGTDPSVMDELMECLQNEILASEMYHENVNDEFELNEAKNVYEKKEEVKVPEKPTIPRWMHICKVFEGNEPVIFKRYFKSWE